MPTAMTARKQASNLNIDLSSARRTLNELERQLARREEKQEAEYRDWIKAKADTFREVLTVILGVFPLIKQLDNDWRREVFCGKQEADPEVEEGIYTLFALLHTFSLHESKLAEKARYYARHGYACDFAPQIEALVRFGEEAEAVLRAWESPALSSAPSFRTPPLNAETSARLRELLF